MFFLIKTAYYMHYKSPNNKLRPFCRFLYHFIYALFCSAGVLENAHVYLRKCKYMYLCICQYMYMYVYCICVYVCVCCIVTVYTGDAWQEKGGTESED